MKNRPAPPAAQLIALAATEAGLALITAFALNLTEVLILGLMSWESWYLPLGFGLSVLTVLWSQCAHKWAYDETGYVFAKDHSHRTVSEEIRKSGWLFVLLPLPALGEELFFCGLVQLLVSAGIYWLGFGLAIAIVGGVIIAAFLFGICHPDPADELWTERYWSHVAILTIQSTLFGSAVAFSYSLWPVIFARGCHNLITGAIEHLRYARYHPASLPCKARVAT